ncbi:MAG TPA: heavy metal translocating P-type ATPase [Candidatus Acidoferrales bacterium]|nr:heavy metal translocating P-type ATPase [Candidatus Acidoferrales bacterium]
MTPTSTALPAPGVGDRRPRLDAFRRPPPRVAWKWSWFNELSIAILTTAGILIHLVLRYFVHAPPVTANAPLYVILVLGGAPLVVTLIRKALIREFGSDLLAGMSIVTAVFLGEYLVACIVVLMLSGGASLEQLASRRASSVLDALAKRMPQSAHRQVDGALHDVALQDVAVGDRLVVFPHEICPVDSVVLEGHGKMNEAYLTGEPFEISKTPGSQVLSGSVNGESALTIRAEKLAVDSRYASIMRVMQETEQRRPRLRRLGDKLGAWYTPVALLLSLLAWLITGESHRFLAVLVVATPCPLLIAIPVAVLGAISLAARRAIIVKNPAVLEQMDLCRTMIFDKTGTLTYGKPSLAGIHCAPGFEKNEVLRLAASLERYSKHPLARAVLDAAESQALVLEIAERMSERPGEGLRGTVSGHELWITGRQKAAAQRAALPPAAPGLECLVFLDGNFAASFHFHDAPRKDTRSFVEHLKPRHAVTRVMLVSGDRDSEVRYLAELAGIREVHSAKSPEEKVEIVRVESARQKTLFVGDGINDAPAMQAATVGVAFGLTSDITSEAADAVILEASLGKVDELIHIGRRMRRIALQSAVGGMALSVLGMIAAAYGLLPPIGGAIAQEVIDLAAVLNAVRVALPFAALTDI